MSATYRFDATLWEWTGKGAAWVFLTLPEEVSDEIDDAHTGQRAGFGSVKVSVRIGDSSWETSIFPSKEAGSFVLPVKKAVRVAEGLGSGSTAHVSLTTSPSCRESSTAPR